MQNSNDKFQRLAEKTIRMITDFSPFLVIGTTIISLLVVFIIDIIFKAGLFLPVMGYAGYVVAFLIPLAIMAARLGFGLLGAKDISDGSWASGFLGLVGTFAIAFYEHTAVTKIAIEWSLADYSSLFQFMVWLAVGAELRLMMTLGSSKNLLNKMRGKQNQKKKPQGQQNQKPKPVPRNEGNGHEDWEFNYNLQGNPT